MRTTIPGPPKPPGAEKSNYTNCLDTTAKPPGAEKNNYTNCLDTIASKVHSKLPEAVPDSLGVAARTSQAGDLGFDPLELRGKREDMPLAEIKHGRLVTRLPRGTRWREPRTRHTIK